MLTATNHGRPAVPRLCRVRIRLCAHNCRLCQGAHKFTDVMDAERIDRDHVRITQPDDLWRGAVLSRSDYEFAEVK